MIFLKNENKEQVARAEATMGDSAEHFRVDVTFMEYVELDKDFGPTIPAAIRIKLDLDNMVWSIYRQSFVRITHKQGYDEIKDIGWVHWVDIPAQLDEDFYDE